MLASGAERHLPGGSAGPRRVERAEDAPPARAAARAGCFQPNLRAGACERWAGLGMEDEEEEDLDEYVDDEFQAFLDPGAAASDE